jgi:cold shock CspA family protein
MRRGSDTQLTYYAEKHVGLLSVEAGSRDREVDSPEYGVFCRFLDIRTDTDGVQPRDPVLASFGSASDRRSLEASVQEMGAVKWYDTMKGFGFIVLDNGGRDVFVHVSALQRPGITGLDEGQRVFVGAAEGRKGPEAASIQVA